MSLSQTYYPTSYNHTGYNESVTILLSYFWNHTDTMRLSQFHYSTFWNHTGYNEFVTILLSYTKESYCIQWAHHNFTILLLKSHCIQWACHSFTILLHRITLHIMRDELVTILLSYCIEWYWTQWACHNFTFLLHRIKPHTKSLLQFYYPNP